jgi:hypothetical protein
MSMKREAENSKQACIELWHFIGACEWEKARALLTDDFEADWPQSNERIVGADNFIEVNRARLAMTSKMSPKFCANLWLLLS